MLQPAYLDDLYLWKKPAFFKNNFLASHTWITSYDISKENKNTLNDYWFCHGDLHTQGDLIGTINSNFAPCLVTPNKPSENGTIKKYAVHGVCHQVFNQIKFNGDCGNISYEDLISIKGYKASNMIFGEFGTTYKEFAELASKCIDPNNPDLFNELLKEMKVGYFSLIIEMASLDDFEIYYSLTNILTIEKWRKELLSNLEIIYEVPMLPLDKMTAKMNKLINGFLIKVYDFIGNAEIFYEIFELNEYECEKITFVTKEYLSASSVGLSRAIKY